jgi:uncharacterized surface protein with fasciclin (FAS1) repeats/plastocyanin
MKPSFSKSILVSVFVLFSATIFAQNLCEADHRVLLTNYSFSPAELIIAPGETVAFINAEGTHNVNGIKNTVTGDSFNNPEAFSLPESEGEINGNCMGVVTFNTPGVYNYDCSIGLQAELGMVGKITVDAFTIKDLLTLNQLPESFNSSFAFNAYLDTVLDGTGSYTVFLPNDEAVNEIMERMQLNQYDMLAFYDLKPALKYHIANGIFRANDLINGQSLPTIYGQDLTISEVDGVFRVNDAEIISTDYTANNGVIHIINKTLAPSGLPKASVWDIIEQSEDHQILASAIQITGFKEPLLQQAELDRNGSTAAGNELPGPFTIFAPTDEAINFFSQKIGMTPEEFLNSPLIYDFINQHIVESKNLSAEITNGQLLQNYSGNNLEMKVNSDGIFVDDVRIVMEDILAYNGVVHVINAIIPIDIPEPSGNCDIWTVGMYDSDGDGWRETQLYIEVDGELISQQTLIFGNSSFYKFGVDSGALVNLYSFSPWADVNSESYILFDGNNQEIASSGKNGRRAGNSLGIIACAETTDCGNLNVMLLDRSGQDEGWGRGTLDVFMNDKLYLSIPFYRGNEQSTSIPVNYGDVFDFYYTEGSLTAEYNSYIVYGPDGDILVDQDNNGQIPASVTDIKVCEENKDVYSEYTNYNTTVYPNLSSENTDTRVFPNPATNQLTIISDSAISHVSISDIFGRKVYDKPHQEMAVDVSSLAGGTYIVRVEKTTGFEFFTVSIIR